MKKYLRISFLAITLLISIQAFSGEPDTLVTSDNIIPETGEPMVDETRQDGINYISSICFFHDSVFSSLPDTVLFPDWEPKEIHLRKYDFSEISDSLKLTLTDSVNKYTHPFKGKVTSEFDTRKWRFHYGVDIDLNTVFALVPLAVRVIENQDLISFHSIGRSATTGYTVPESGAQVLLPDYDQIREILVRIFQSG